MDPLLTEEQALLRDSAAKLVAGAAGPARLRAVRAGASGHDAALWREIARAGWLALGVAEAAGGLGRGMTELALVMEEAGRGLSTVPVAHAVAACRALSDNAEAAEVLASALAGERVVVPALAERIFDVDPLTPATCAEAGEAGVLRLTGRKVAVAGAAAANGFVVGAAGSDGPVVAYVPRAAEGLGVALSPAVDGGRVGTLTLDRVSVPPGAVLARGNGATELLSRMADETALLLAAELVGVMDRAFAIATDYLKTRVQFDKPIGSFQALQHRAADNFIEIELTRSLVYQVAAAMDRGQDAGAMAAAVKAKASAAALSVCKAALQFHGAMGYTDEHDIGLYLKRAMALAAEGGNESASRRRFARLAGIEPA